MKIKISKAIFLLPLLVAVLACTERRIESALKNAEELKGTRKVAEAAQVYKHIINSYPEEDKTAVAYLRLGDMQLYTFGKPNEALNNYNKIIDKWPFSESAKDAALRIAEISRTRDDYRKAIERYEWVLKHFSRTEDRFQVMLQLAEAYMSLQDYYQAAAELSEIIESKEIVEEETLKKANYNLAESLFMQEKYENALEKYTSLNKKHPEAIFSIDVKLRILETLIHLNKMEESKNIISELLSEENISENTKLRIEGLIRREEKKEKPEIKVDNENKSNFN